MVCRFRGRVAERMMLWIPKHLHNNKEQHD